MAAAISAGSRPSPSNFSSSSCINSATRMGASACTPTTWVPSALTRKAAARMNTSTSASGAPSLSPLLTSWSSTLYTSLPPIILPTRSLAVIWALRLRA
ncbi:hypothetical protein K523DRAFT_288501, partial [Schizophyllum commune Tattone D]